MNLEKANKVVDRYLKVCCWLCGIMAVVSIVNELLGFPLHFWRN